MKNIDKSHNIYIIKITNGKNTLIKLGYSSNIVVRLYTYYCHNPLVEILGTYYREDAEDFEKLFHSNYTSEILNEWYKEDMLDIMVDCIEDRIKLKKAKEITYENLRELAEVELKGYEPDLLKYEQLMIENYGNTKKWNHMIEGYSLRLSQDIQVKAVRQGIYKVVKLNNWYSKQELFDLIAPIIKEFKGEISKVKCGILVDHYFEIEDSSKRIDGVKTQGVTIKSIR